jgi:hypothetical protein
MPEIRVPLSFVISKDAGFSENYRGKQKNTGKRKSRTNFNFG